MGDRRGVYRVLVGRSEGKRPLGRPRTRWEDNIKMYLQEVGWGGINWFNLALVNSIMNPRDPYNVGNVLTS
jgi:hypothetical protein